MKILKFIIMIIFCVFGLTTSALAHSGNTDVHGGHYDHSTGEYHYHHGYYAHSHYDIDGDGTLDCPITYKSNTSTNQDKSNTSTNQEENKKTIFDFIGMLMSTIGSAISYIVSIKIYDIPLHLFYLAALITCSYCVSVIIIGFPCEIYKKISNKEIKDGFDDKLIRIGTVCFTVIFALLLLS